MNFDVFTKPWRMISIILLVCLMISPAWADIYPVPDYFSKESLPSEEGFTFESESDELILADNKSYTTNKNKRTKEENQRGKIKLDTHYFKSLFSDAGYVLTSPPRWERSDWVKASLIAGVTGAFFVLDDEIMEESQDFRSSTTDDMTDFLEPFGNGAFTLPALAGLYLYGRYGENQKAERTALLATESFLITGLFTTVLKVSFGRHRPSTGNSADTFDGPSTSNKSFPSGHTSTAFAIATVVANEYEDVPLVPSISYGIATLAGLSRINDNKHWASDVFFGAALGYFTSKTILRLHSNKKGRHFTIYPRADYRGGGLVLSTRF